MNVLFVSDVSIAELVGGAERILFEQSTILQKMGHNVHILTRKLPGDKSGHEIIRGVNEWRYDVNRRNPFSFIISTLLNSKKLFESIQNQYSFSCINSHQPFSGLAVTRAHFRKKFYSCHSFSFEEFRSRHPKPKDCGGKIQYFLNIQVRKFIEKRALRNSSIVIVLSRFTKEKLQHVYKIPSGKITIIPGGVDLDRFYPATDRSRIRKRLNIPQKKTILFTLRNLVPRMGLENLIYAVKEVAKTVPIIHLVLGGDGPLKNDLISLTKELGIENHVKIIGFISEAELPDYYRMADIFILPTVELEGFGLVTLEALASGVPVLGTPLGGTVEILSKLNSKYLFKDTDPGSMAELIIKTCQEFKNNAKLWKDVSFRCRTFVEENYSWEKNVKSMENLFASIDLPN